jgi:outer membrane cobalamin receptor
MFNFRFSIVLIVWAVCSFICKVQGDSLSVDDTLAVRFTQRDSISAATDSPDSIHDTTTIIDSIKQYSHTLVVDTIKSVKTDTTDFNLTKLDKVYVDAVAEREFQSNQSVSIIKVDDVVGYRKTIADIIAEEPGVQTRKYGGEGSFQTVSVRGVEGKEVLVFLDGALLNSAMGGAVDLSLIDPECIDEIRLYKGFVPAEFGGNAIGGVIDIKSKHSLKDNAGGVNASVGAYGFQKYNLQLNHFVNEKARLFGAARIKVSENDWKYIDRNNTPYNPDDDIISKVKNHRHKSYAVSLLPSFYMSSGRVAFLDINITSSSTGIHGDEGSDNKTALEEQGLLLLALRLNRDVASDVRRFVLTPRISYSLNKSKVFWTSLDESMGTSHGSISTIPNAYGKLESNLNIVSMSTTADWYITKNIGAVIHVAAKQSVITANEESSHLPVGSDYPANSQELGIAADLHFTGPILLTLSPEAVVAASINAVRNETEGGENFLLARKITHEDTLLYPWSVRGGLGCGISEYLRVFSNIARYTSIPSIRERYGYNGAFEPNENLQNENGLSVEAGVRFKKRISRIESVCFYQSTKNGIKLESDGAMTRPVNIEKTRTYGVEFNGMINPIQPLMLTLSGTWQKARNLSHRYSEYGLSLPNEPDLSLQAGCQLTIRNVVILEYEVGYKTVFYRDRGNTWQIPENSKWYGTFNHSTKAEITINKKIKAGVSVSNVSGNVFTLKTLISGADESGYSWTTYPQNEWNIYVRMVF